MNRIFDSAGIGVSDVPEGEPFLIHIVKMKKTACLAAGKMKKYIDYADGLGINPRAKFRKHDE